MFLLLHFTTFGLQRNLSQECSIAQMYLETYSFLFFNVYLYLAVWVFVWLHGHILVAMSGATLPLRRCRLPHSSTSPFVEHRLLGLWAQVVWGVSSKGTWVF